MRLLSLRPSLLVMVVLAGCPRSPSDTADTDTADNDTDSGDTDTDTDTDTGTPDRPVRVATWNIEGVADSTTTLWDEYLAAIAVLTRIDADVVCINEVSDAGEASDLEALAQDLDMGTVYSPPNSINPNPYQRNGVMTRLPVISGPVALTSATLSGDSGASDLTRLPVSITVDLPGETEHLTVVCQHWKSGFDDVDEFRRVVDSRRTVQAAERATTSWVLVAGDVNSEVTDSVEFPNPFTSMPSGFPGDYELGADLNAVMTSTGLVNDPFQPFDVAGFEVAEARQQDGTFATRPVSGRRIDYVIVGPDVPTGWKTEVFDCVDDAAGLEGLPKKGSPVMGNACGQASDHLPVIFDLAP